jgi:hypothetical protein
MRLLFTALACLISVSVFGQTTVVLNPIDDAIIRQIDGVGDETNYGDEPSNSIHAWTNNDGKSIVIHHSLINFYWSSIPNNAVILNAELYLYNDENSSQYPNGHDVSGGSNSCILQRITSDWNENIVTWNNQPGTTNENQCFIPQSTYQHEDYIVNVTSIVEDILDNPESGFGFSIKLNNPIPYRRLVFATNDHYNNSILGPKLHITYEDVQETWDCVANSCIDPNDGGGFYSILEICEQDCSPSSIYDVILQKRKLEKVVDALGREVNHTTNQILFYIYDDGSVEKKFIVD